MDKYIVVINCCNKISIANKIVDTLLNKKLVSGSQMTEIKSKYWWNNEIEESVEYKLEFRTKIGLKIDGWFIYFDYVKWYGVVVN